MAKTVVCTVNSVDQAETIVDELRGAGFQSEDISILAPDKETQQELDVENTTKSPEAAATGMTAGGIVGGALGWLAGIGSLAIPGAGPFVAAGPIMSALSGAAIGGTVGGIAGALIGLGLPEYEAKIYANKVQQGSILIAAQSHENELVKRAQDIFKAQGARDVHTVGATLGKR